MNDVSLHVPYIFGNKQNSKHNTEREDTEGTTESREAWYQVRPTQGPNRPEREAKLTHTNLQISKCLCIIIRSCKIHKG